MRSNDHSARKVKGLSTLPAGLTFTAGTIYLITLFVGGLLTNFIPLGSINTGTILLYSLASFLSFAGILSLLGPLRKHIAAAAFIMLALSCLAIVKAALDSNPVSQRARELAILFLGAWPFLFFIQVDTPEVRQRFEKILALGLFGLSAFSIFQSIFANSLPLSLFVLRGDAPFFVLNGDDLATADLILRPTGLTGNPIILSSILVFASSYFAAQWFEKRRLRFLLALICSLMANYVTYTRASVVLVIPVLICVWLFHKRFHIKHKAVVVFAVVVAIGGGQYLLANGGSVIVIQRLQGLDPESIRSTLGHFAQIQNAEEAIVSHPLMGVGVGSQGDFVDAGSVIITDGAWWTLLLEFGVPLSVLAVVSLCFLLTPLIKYVLDQHSVNRSLAIATLSFHVYIFPGNIINSAILGHISFGLYWVVLGLSLAGINRDSAPNPRWALVDLPPKAEPEAGKPRELTAVN